MGDRNETTKGQAGSSDWDDLLLPGMIAVGGVVAWSAWGGQVTARWDAMQAGDVAALGEWAPAAAAIVALFVLVGMWLTLRRWARRRLRARVEAAVRTVAGAGSEVERTMVRLRWRGRQVRRLQVYLPAGAVVVGERRALLRRALAEAVGAELDSGRWDGRRNQVTYRVVLRTPAEAHQAAVVERLDAAVATVVGAPPGTALVTVIAWGEAGPVSLTIDLPASWDPTIAAQTRLRGALQSKTGIDWDPGDWDLRNARVTFQRDTRSPGERRHAELVERLDHAVGALVGRPVPDRAMVSVPSWVDHTPAAVEVRYPAAWIPDDRRRADLRAVLAMKCGVELDDGAWNTVADHVRFHPAAPAAAEAERPAAEVHVEALLTQLRLPVTSVAITAWTDGEPEAIEVTHAPHAPATRPRWQDFTEAVVAAVLPGRWTAAWKPAQSTVSFRRRPTLPSRVVLPVGLLQRDTAEGIVIPLGVTEDGPVHEWRWADSPHALVVGPTNAGKTTLIRLIAMLAARQGVEVVMVDPKWVEFPALHTWPNIVRIASETEDMIDTIEGVHREMERRYSLGLTAGTAHRILLVIDEYFILGHRLNRWWAKNKKAQNGSGREHPVMEMIEDIAALGRTAGIHLCVGLQRPDASFLGEGGGALRDNLRERISLGRMSRSGAQMMWDNPKLGIDIPNGLRGRGIVESATGLPHEMQSFWSAVPANLDQLDADELAVLDALHPPADRVVTPTFKGLPPTIRTGPPAPQSTPEHAEGEGSGVSFDAEAGQLVEWVAAEQLVPGDRVVLDGGTVTLTAADYDDDDGTATRIEWPGGVLVVSVEENVQRVLATLVEEEPARA